MDNNTLHAGSEDMYTPSLHDCFEIMDRELGDATKHAVMEAGEFELEYAFHTGLEQWVCSNIVKRYGLRGEDFFIALNLWDQCLLVNDPEKFSTFIIIEYRKHLLLNNKS